MSARTKYRKRALDILFESELQGLPVGGTLSDRLAINDPPVNSYSVQLVEGVAGSVERIDALIAAHAAGWTLDRMPAVDRNLLRIATYEIIDVEDVPPAVAIAEAVDLAQELSTEESAGFINGVLSAIANSGGGDGSTTPQAGSP